MAVDQAGPITLIDMARGEQDDLMAGILLQYAQQSLVMQQLPFNTTNAWQSRSFQIESVGTTSTRRIGQGYTSKRDTITEQVDGIYIGGGQIDIDRALRAVGQNDVNAYVENINLQTERFRYDFLDMFINGNRVTDDADGFNGLKKRVADLVADGFSDALVEGASASSGLALTSSALRQTFLDKLSEAEFNVADGMVDAVLTGKEGWLALERVVRREGLLDTTSDHFDRKISTFRGIPFMFMGFKGDQSTQIITATEDPGDSGDDATSYYFVRYGRPYLSGEQANTPEVIFDAVISDGVTHRMVWEWYHGLSSFNKRSIVRLSKILPNAFS